MGELIARKSRYVIPFRFGAEERSKRDYIRFLERRADRYHGRWFEDDVRAGEQDLYGYVLNSFNDRGRFSPGNIGAVYRYGVEGKEEGSDVMSLRFEEGGSGGVDGLSCLVSVASAGMVLFVTGVGFFWYEIGAVLDEQGNPLSVENDIRFQGRFKELNLERNLKAIRRGDGGADFTMGDWAAEVVTSACPGATFFAARQNIIPRDDDRLRMVPDKALLFQYAAFDEQDVTMDEMRDAAYHLTKGYNRHYRMPKGIDEVFQYPFDNVIWFASKEGAGYYARTGHEEAYFFKSIMPERFARDYFMLYILALNEQYATLRFAERMSDELPADPQAYLTSDLYLDVAGAESPNEWELLDLERKVTRLTTEINVFFTKNTRLTVSFIEHQDQFYRYLIKELGVRDDTHHLMQGLSALQALLRDIVKQEETVNRAVVQSWRRERAYQKLEEEKEILRKELYEDAATGLYNKKGLLYFGRKLYAEARKNNKALFICVCDMNGLKYINDNFGHEAGDDAINRLAGIIRESVLEGDYAFRQGGDEFLVLGIREYGSDEENAFSKRVEAAMQHCNESRQDNRYPVAMSYGPFLADLRECHEELNDLIKISDERMYEMKKKRDQYRRS